MNIEKRRPTMMPTLSRRRFLASTATAIAGAAAGVRTLGHALAAEAETTVLRVESRVIEVGGKAAKAFSLRQPDGTWGLLTEAGRRFRVRLENLSDEPTLIHWHGLLSPYGQDGVPDLPQPLLPAGQSYDYDFPLDTPGTHWMHAHTLQEQQLLAAPLIVADPAEAGLDEQPVVVLFHDFSFKSPEELLAGLRGAQATTGMQGHGAMHGTSTMPGHTMPNMPQMPGMMGGMAMDINDIDYDAYLANDRALDDPEVFRVERGGRVRLRLINGATATAFWIDLGPLDGEAIAVDGNPIAPVAGRRFPLGMGQRIDIRIALPAEEGAWPILALREGAAERAGFVLATKGGTIGGIGSRGDAPTPPLDVVLEARLRAVTPLTEKPVDRRETVVLGGDMAAYLWTLDGRTWGDHRPLKVRAGERIEVTLANQSMMGHPMHLHGHHFQVVAIDGERLAGAVRDTVWVPPMRSLTVAFDTANPGQWAFHCHHLYHMATGMMTTVSYET
jgi:FtsP/CotA-like multicopper oxidase with cupredoxin domain